MTKMAKIRHLDPKSTTKNSSIQPNQFHGSVLGGRMTVLVVGKFTQTRPFFWGGGGGRHSVILVGICEYHEFRGFILKSGVR